MVETKNLIKAFRDGETETRVLKGVDFKAESGEWVAIMGRSGAGKSTLMYQMSLLDEPTSGDIIIDGCDVKTMNNEARTKFRLRNFGYVFQDYALLPELNALENVALPLLMQGLSTNEAYKKATKSLLTVNIASELHDNYPSQLSGGEQQRVSISRAIAHDPRVLFADEPTANLDVDSAHIVMDIFKQLNKAGQTIIMVTHEEEFGALADRITRLSDGLIIS